MHAYATFFEDESVLASAPVLREYLADLVRPYDLALRDDLLTAGVGQSYGEMGERLIRTAVPDGTEIDLLVLAHAVPDVRPGRSTALYLSSVCPGRPQAFAICDQGSAAAFTATRLAAEFLRSGECRTALVLILEQSALLYELRPDEDGEVPALPDRHAGVAVRYDTSLPTVYQYTSVLEKEAGTLLCDTLADLVGPGWTGRLVLGPGLGGIAVDLGYPGQAFHSGGQPMTGLWARLVDPPLRDRQDPVILADHDAWSHTLNLCVLDGTGG